MNYLNQSKIRVFSYLVFFSLISCQSVDGDFKKLETYLTDVHQYALINETKAIVVISEDGECMKCNNSFTQFISSEKDNKKILFLICSTGMLIDISSFNPENENVLMDQHYKLKDTGLIDGSGIIFLENSTIDTIVTVSSESLPKDMVYITNKLN